MVQFSMTWDELILPHNFTSPFSHEKPSSMKTITLIAIIFASLPLKAQTRQCGNLKWSEDPRISSGLFMGKMENNCVVTGLRSADIRKLHDYFEAKALDNVVIKHQGPDAESSLGLPGLRWDITVETNEGRIRNLLRIASDDRAALAYSIHSKEINFRGMAGYMRKLNIDYRVEVLSATSVRITLNNLVHVQKPAVAPSGMFLRMAINNSEGQFTQSLNNLVDEVVRNL